MSIASSYIRYCLFTALIALLALGCENNELDTPAPGAYIKMPQGGFELELNDTLVLAPKITYEVDAQYSWYLGDELISEEKELSHISKALGKISYTFIVTNPRGADTLMIPVSTIIIIDFKEFSLGTAKYDLGAGGTNHPDGFYSKGLIFPTYAPSEDQWVGFGLSKLRSNSLSNLSPSLYSAFAPISKDSIFLIYQEPLSPEALAMHFEDNMLRRISSISVTNSTFAYLFMRNGTDQVSRFGDEASANPLDWFLLTIKGYDEKGMLTGTVEFYMADYRFDNKKKNYIIGEWTDIDLSSLGLINSLSFSFSSSKNSEQGLIQTPPFLCIDRIKIIE